MLKYLRWFLLPFSWLYGLVILTRNWCYDAGIFKSHSFNIPVISVGNLDVGGAGKSPMTEYLIRLLKNNHKLATLSRGYGRKTQGFLKATQASTATEIGDEPAQFKQKFPDITVAVCESRVAGINQLKANIDLVILDDAYQHRAVKPGLSILLFDYSRIFEPHFMLPAGNLREPFGGIKRANIIIISKCPHTLADAEQQAIVQRIKPLANQSVFFTAINYSSLYPVNSRAGTTQIDKDTVVFIITGIANPAPLLNHVKKQAKQVIHHNYPDHHQFTLKNITKLADEFLACPADKKLILTTEKDIQRLREHELVAGFKQLPLWVLPIEVQFLNNNQAGFNNIIQNYVRQYKANRQLH
ncbi:lipid-A-disaccharide kinase [Mucilaginibacter gracilis]|uniref:Tetraacyldisaccharide 4'-kinase n=1 Tax=Mucilaginibacter gracilis TaxID=423350 RepID=A0A495IW36_9SPHI|nr:tetraacyldisaccharide 4'-kinase [Mucilaginibacter gracilis]RKR80234.1 lipid-A-disaccharide kinase [Mucilaginibacter gracilis]